MNSKLPEIPLLVRTCLSLAIGIAWVAHAYPVETSSETAPATEISPWGIPRNESYYPRDTGLSGTVQHITSLPDGEMAFLSTIGLYLFDGTNWETQPQMAWATTSLELPDGSTAVSHNQGVTQLTPDGKGGYTQTLLTPPDKYTFGIAPLTSLAYARGFIFGLVGENLVTIAPDGAISHHRLANWATTCFAIGEEIYVTGGAQSLLNRWNWATQSLDDASSYLEGSSIYEWMLQVTPRSEGGVWIRTAENKVIGFDGQKTWAWPGNTYLTQQGVRIRTFVEASSEKLAIGSATQGLLVFRDDGNFEFAFSKQHGLDSINIEKIAPDSQGGIWIATQNSLTRLAHSSRTIVFGQRHGLVDDVDCIAFFQNKIYLGTTRGLYASNPQASKMEELFQLVIEQTDVEDLLVSHGYLFASGSKAMAIDPEGNIVEMYSEGVSNFIQLKSHPDTVLAGDFRGILRFDYRDGRFARPTRLDGPALGIFSITENAHGELFGSLGDSRYTRILLDETGGGSYEIVDLPQRKDSSWSSILSVEGEIYISGEPCLRWDHDQQTFVEDLEMKYYVGDAPYGFEQVFGTSSDKAFVGLNARSGFSVPRPGPSIIGEISSIGNAIDTRAFCIAYDAAGGLWAGGPFGLLYSPLSEHARATESPRPRIHSITSIRDGIAIPIESSPKQPVSLAYKQNSLQIKIEFPLFAGSQHHQYQIHLEGFDGDWLPYSATSLREFTNLAPGSYTLNINAKDASGRVSRAAAYTFIVLPPWYLTVWAMLIYFFSAILLVVLIVYGYSRNQIRKSRELQALVDERTQEIQTKNAELQTQSQRLARQNEELAEKTEELTATAETLSSTLHQLQDMQEQLVSTARTAGKAEIAINVLHNVGNVLNSINVSINVLSDKVSQSKAFKLAKFAKLIESHKSDIHSFLTQDPRGKAVPEYLIQVSEALGEEANSVLHELGVMEEDIDHVKNIIAAQQTHAKNQSIIEPLNVKALCQSALSILGNDQIRSQLEIIDEIPDDIVIENDKHRLLEIILNLISNAQDAIRLQNPEIGVITLSAETQADEQTLLLKITDNGCGIASETQEQLFRHGFTTKQNGHGFGLHSSANAAQTLGGSLAISSPGLGKGATAVITLPLRTQPQRSV